jgi:hypothetical protein
MHTVLSFLSAYIQSGDNLHHEHTLLGSLRYQYFNYVNCVFVFNVHHIMIRFGKSPHRTFTSSKRVLSSTSPNSPLHEGKKTKTFTSPNRFAVLASIDTNDDTIRCISTFLRSHCTFISPF